MWKNEKFILIITKKFFVKLIQFLSFQVLAAIGGVFALFLDGPGFWSFIYWSTAIISALFIALRVFNIMPALEQRFALMSKVVSKIRNFVK